MISAIEDAVVVRIQAKLDQALAALGIQKGTEGIPEPGVYISTEEGAFTKVSSDTFKQEITCYADIVFKHLGSKGEEQRRKGVYLILEGIVLALLLQKLELEITPIIPKSFRNNTTEEAKSKGLIVYSLTFTTSYHIKRVDDEALEDLLAIGLQYYLKPGDDVADASDQIDLS
jgi:hypothetical protein